MGLSDVGEEPHYAWDDRQLEASPAQPLLRASLVGVRGWLLFLCVSLCILSPIGSLLTFFFMVTQWSGVLARFPGLLGVVLISGVLGAALMGGTIYAGVRLWRLRPGAVRTAKIVLLAIVAYQVLDAILPFFAGLPAAANRAMLLPVIVGLVRSLIYPALWYAYLTNSKRVCATYPDEFPPPAQQALQPDAPDVSA